MTGTEEAREVDRLAGIVAAVRELHGRDLYDRNFCRSCDRQWPCPTARLVNPEVTT